MKLDTSILIPVSFSRPSPTLQEPPSQGDTPSGNGGVQAPAPGPADAGQQGSLAKQDPNDPGGGAGGTGGGGSSSTFFLVMLAGIALMLFFTSRSNSKARKAQAALLSSIKQGDRVVTSSGIHGIVHQLSDTTVTLLLDSAQVTFERSAIARVLGDDAAQTA